MKNKYTTKDTKCKSSDLKIIHWMNSHIFFFLLTVISNYNKLYFQTLFGMVVEMYVRM